MRFAIISLAVAGLATAASYFDDIPKCARPCLEAAYPKVGCALEDLGCACFPKNQEKIGAFAKDCVISQCGIFKAIEAKNQAKKKCKKFAEGKFPEGKYTGGGY